MKKISSIDFQDHKNYLLSANSMGASLCTRQIIMYIFFKRNLQLLYKVHYRIAFVNLTFLE